MIAIRQILSLNTIALMLSGNGLSAQSAGNPESTWITPVFMEALAAPLFYENNYNEFVELKAGVRARGESIKVTIPGRLELFAEGTDPETGAAQWASVATATWDANWRTVILLIGKSRSGLFTYPMDDSLAAHPQNSMRVINFTQTRIGMLVGEERRVIERNQRSIFPVDAYTGARIPFRIVLETEQGGDWVSYLSNEIRMRSNTLRTNYIAYTSADSRLGTSSIAAFGITGMPPLAPEANPTGR